MTVIPATLNEDNKLCSYRLPRSIRAHLQFAKNSSFHDKTTIVKMALKDYLEREFPVPVGAALPTEIDD